MEKITTIGLDLDKSVFQVHAVAEDGRVVIRRALRRSQLLEFSAASSRALLDLRPARVRIIGRMPSASSGIWSG